METIIRAYLLIDNERDAMSAKKTTLPNKYVTKYSSSPSTECRVGQGTRTLRNATRRGKSLTN